MRCLLPACVALALAAAVPVRAAAPTPPPPPAATLPAGLTIAKLEMIELHIPFYSARVRQQMHRANTHGERVLIYRAELSNGIVGYGESPMNESARIKPLLGAAVAAVLNDDRIGFGIQMALMDAAGKTAGVPTWRLLGTKVRDKIAIAWWAIDMPPEDWAAEVKQSIAKGCTSIKLKGRPWRDIFAQIDAISKVAPEDYHLAIDFNGFLHNLDEALPILQELQKNPRVTCYESPFYLGTDLPAAAKLRTLVRPLVVDHFSDKIVEASGGFLVTANFQSLSLTRKQDAMAVAASKPYWLQMVGTGLTAAYMTHVAAVMPGATLPSVTCHQLWEHDLLKTPLEIKGGFISVPTGNGLGVQIDEAAFAKYRVEPNTPTPQELSRLKPPRLRIHIPQGDGKAETVMEFSREDDYYQDYLKGKYPGFRRGTRMEIIERP